MRIAVLLLSAGFSALRPHAAQALSFEALDAAAAGVQETVSSAAASAFPSSATIFLTDLETAGAGFGEAPRAFKEFLFKRLLENRNLIVILGPDAAASADLFLSGALIELDGRTLAAMRLVDRRRQVLLAARQELLGSAPIRPRAPDAARPPREAGARGRWLVFAGPTLGGSDVGWNAGAAFRPAEQTWETSFELGGDRHHDTAPRYGPVSGVLGLSTYSSFSTTYLRLRGEALRRVDVVPTVRGEPLWPFHGFIKAGGGVGIYRLRERYEEEYFPSSEPTRAHFSTHWVAAPMLDVALVRSIGEFLELQVSGEYVWSPEKFGVEGYNVGGWRWGLRLAYRFF